MKYTWYYMPVSVHKVLMHGAPVITAAILPIGQLSEEAQESLHELLKAYQKYQRKLSRISTNTPSGILIYTDFIHCLLVSLDPFTTNKRPLHHKQTPWIPKYMLHLISLLHQRLCELSDLDRTESGGSQDEKGIE